MIVDNDLLSIQQARILAENARAGQQKLATFSQETLDGIVDAMAVAVSKRCRELAVLSQEETTYGHWRDKWIKNQFVCENIPRQLRDVRCVGIVERNEAKGLITIGVPRGVIAAACPVTNPVSTTIFKALIAIKSGNAIVFSPHPKAMGCIGATLDIMTEAALKAGLPEGSIGYMRTVTLSGTAELMRHHDVNLLLVTGVDGLYPLAQAAGKPLIYGGTGSGPAFVERSADIDQAARDIVSSKSFDHGMAPSAEQSIVADACIAAKAKEALQRAGAYFMTPQQSETLSGMLFCPNGRRKRDTVGVSADKLAERAGFITPAGTKILVAECGYVLENSPYSRELHAPVLAFYVEDDWMHACEKCIELLLYERKSHTLAIHSNNQSVIEQFALRKPVGRLLVNTPAAFGGMGVTTNLFPSPVLGGASTGHGIAAGNVSPCDLVYTRMVGMRAREFNPNLSEQAGTDNPGHSASATMSASASGRVLSHESGSVYPSITIGQGTHNTVAGSEPQPLQVLEHLLTETIQAMQRPPSAS